MRDSTISEMRLALVPHERAAARVLLVEDNPALATGTAEALAHLGNQVDWQASARAAYDALARPNAYTAVVLDLGLGDCDGVTLIQALRAHGHRLPPIVVLSAWPSDALRHAVQAIGATAGLQKPCSLTMLENALRVAQDADRD